MVLVFSTEDRSAGTAGSPRRRWRPRSRRGPGRSPMIGHGVWIAEDQRMDRPSADITEERPLDPLHFPLHAAPSAAVDGGAGASPVALSHRSRAQIAQHPRRGPVLSTICHVTGTARRPDFFFFFFFPRVGIVTRRESSVGCGAVVSQRDRLCDCQICRHRTPPVVDHNKLPVAGGGAKRHRIIPSPAAPATAFVRPVNRCWPAFRSIAVDVRL